ncbi:dioxygenase family protein [Streptomyces stelliscabiei]|uniref:dioxygenase family protein n=1 Tax=Streptomyces stelliscabiei TaxID=146820 RepID=UPI002FF38721
MTTTTDPSYVDPALINARAVRLVNAFKDALARMRDEEGLTFDDLHAATDLLQKVQAATGAPLALVSMPLFSEVFQGGRDGYTPSEEVNSPTYIADSPRIDNPGILPMRPDEPGTPLVVSGRVLDGKRRPIEGAKVDIYHAANNGDYSGLYDDGVPRYNLRGHLFTDADGRYAFTTITPVAYADSHIMEVDGVTDAVAALGRSLYRPAHIHYEVHHPDLIAPWRGEVYFKGDPVIPVDFVGGTLAPPALQADTVLHEDPKDMATAGFQGPYRSMEFDFVLKTRTSPDTITPSGTTA